MAKRFPLRRLLLVVGLFSVGVFTLLTTDLTATATSYTFTPEADSYVNANAPTTNYGTNSLIWMDSSPETNGYLRFDVQNLDGPVSSATLRVLMGSTNSTGFDVHQVADTSWIETGTGEIIYNNAPTIGSVINASGSVTTNVWAEIDVTSYITGNGLYSFGTTTSSNSPMRFRTRDSSTPPELVIETGSGATDTPTATATSTSTSTPTPTDGPSPTPTSTGTPTATATATNTFTLTPTTPAGGGSTFTFSPVADASVIDNRPNNNYGTTQTLEADISPDMRSYLRFDIQGLDGSVVTATLRLYSLDTSSTGIGIVGVSDTSWGETTITYNNAPTLGSTINASGATTVNTWIEIDISSYITGEGLVSLAFTTTDPSLRLTFGSREAANSPELIVGTSGGPTPTFTPTPTATPTETPTVPAGSTRNWQQISATPAPSVVGEYAMAYGNGTFVLYGGNATGWPYGGTASNNSPFEIGGTWEFNGTDWTEVTTISQPKAVYGMSMVYDENNDVMLVFGGSDYYDSSLSETWTFDGSDWSQVSTANSPPARTYSQMVYTGSGTTTEIYLFGGNDGTTYYNDVWRYDGSDWSQVTTGGTSPTARTHHAIAFDPTDGTDGTIFLFGGRDVTGTQLADSWEYDVNTDSWSQSAFSGPSARMAHGLAYDATEGVFVLVGGANNDGDTILNDTWHYDSTSGWIVATPTQAAPNVAYHLLIYDSTNDLLLLFTNSETWQYD